jgi:polyphosphate:AMP phosphotransferase
MLENLDMKARLGRKEYENSLEVIHRELGSLQRQLKEKGIPVLVVVEGWEASGKGYVINEMLRPLDPRGFYVRDEAEEDPKAASFPPFRRFWKMVPEKGKIVFLNRSWYRLLFKEKNPAYENAAELGALLSRVHSFEENLIADGIQILKIFLHVGAGEQKKRIDALAKNPSTRWRVSENDFDENRNYKKNLKVWENILIQSDSPSSPWICIPAEDLQVAAKKALEALLLFFRDALERTPLRRNGVEVRIPLSGILQRVDLNRSINSDKYREELPALQKMLLEKQYDLYRRKKAIVILFEGWDAAGKGGAIKRLTQGLDPRGYVVHPISAPNEWEKAHPYLWRFWLKLPSVGHIAIFDRSWYGRVLVERVEGFCSENDWERAYGEINRMESEWIKAGYGLVKFWMHIDPEEQLKRFREREKTDYKKWKITPEDWRNREKWDQYEAATEEMLQKTSPPDAPWTIVEGNDKRFARIKVLKTVLSSLKVLLHDD